jgi:tetratricopeptide (TPR) repeat protein
MIRIWRNCLAVMVLLAAPLGMAPPVDAATEHKPRKTDIAVAPTRLQDGRFGDYLAARTAQLDHDWRNAGPMMHRAWEADRANVELRHDALLLSIAAGDFAGATEIAHTVEAASADAALAGFVLTLEDIAEGRYEAAQTRLAASQQRGLDRYVTPLLIAWCEAGRGRKAEAMAALTPLDSIDGAAELRALQGAQIAELLGDKAQANLQYAKLVDDKPSTRALAAAAHFYEREGDVDRARAMIERLDPDGSSASLRIEMLARSADRRRAPPAPSVRSGVADALFDIASSLSGQQQADIAPLLYARFALFLQPDFPSGQMLLADVEQHYGRYDDAAEFLLGVDPKSEMRSSADRAAMAVLDKGGQDARAIAIGKAAVDAHPEDIDLVLTYADLLRRKTRFVEAIATYDAVLARIPETSNRRGVALYHRGIAYQQAHQWPKAETDLLAALNLRPDDPGILNYLAFSWADQGINLDRARTMLERAVQLAPDDGAIVDSLGWVMFRAGDYDDAVTQLEKAVTLDADDADINDHLGDAYWRAGRQIEARAQWEKAERLTTDKAQAEQIRAKLKDGLDPSTPPRRASAD